MSKEIGTLESLGWRKLDNETWQQGNRFVEFGLPYIDIYIYKNEIKYKGYLTIEEWVCFNKILKNALKPKTPRKSKYLGKIYDGMWEVVDIIYPYNNNKVQVYVLENIYSNKKMTISSRALKKVDAGISTIGKTIHRNYKNGYKHLCAKN